MWAQLLLNADSIGTLLNRAEYTQRVTMRIAQLGSLRGSVEISYRFGGDCRARNLIWRICTLRTSRRQLWGSFEVRKSNI